MATTEQKDIRRELGAERERLTAAVEELRGEIVGVRANVRSKLPIAAAGALALGVLRMGGVRVAARLLMRRRREPTVRRFRPFDRG